MEETDVIITLKPIKEWVSAKTKNELADKFEEALAVIPGIEIEFSQPIEMRFNEFQKHRGQKENGNQGATGHKSIKGIGNVPDQSQIHCGAQDGHQRVQNVVYNNDLASEDKLGAAGAVQAPGYYGREGEAAHSHGGEDGYPIAVNRGEAGDGKLRACVLTVGNGYAAEQYHQSGHGADHNGVHKNLENSEHTLLHRLFGIGAGVGNGAGAETCFVGEDTP